MKWHIEAYIKQEDSNTDYWKHVFASESNDVDLHMQALVKCGFRVLSVKSRPWDESDDAALEDRQGNMSRVDGVAVHPLKEM